MSSGQPTSSRSAHGGFGSWRPAPSVGGGGGLLAAAAVVLALVLAVGMYVLGAASDSARDELGDLPGSVDVPAAMEAIAGGAFGHVSAAGVACQWTRESVTDWTCPLSERDDDSLSVRVWTPWAGSCWVATDDPEVFGETSRNATTSSATGPWVILFSARSPRSVAERIDLLRRVAATDPSLHVDLACPAAP